MRHILDPRVLPFCAWLRGAPEKLSSHCWHTKTDKTTIKFVINIAFSIVMQTRIRKAIGIIIFAGRNGFEKGNLWQAVFGATVLAPSADLFLSRFHIIVNSVKISLLMFWNYHMLKQRENRVKKKRLICITTVFSHKMIHFRIFRHFCHEESIWFNFGFSPKNEVKVAKKIVRKKRAVPHNFKQLVRYIGKPFPLTFHVYVESSGAY